MLLRRVSLAHDSTFYIMNSGLAAFRQLARIDDEVSRTRALDDALAVLRHATQQGWFYENPRDSNQLIAYCGAYRKPFWLVVTSGDRDGFEHIERDYVLITCLGHRDKKFREAIEEHRALVSTADASGPHVGDE